MVDFQKKNWQFRDIISEDELNRMEDGIEEGITKAEQAQQTADDVRNDLDALTADYEQNAIKTTGDWVMLGELTLHKFNIGNTEWTTTHAVAFGNNSYEKVDIEIPKGIFLGTFEITLMGGFNEGNATGSITKVIHAGFREDGRIDLNESYYTQVSSFTASHFAISDIIFDPVKDKFVIKIVHRTNFSANTRIIVKGKVGTIGSLNVLKQITFSDIYTTDTTQYERPYRTGVIIESGENANGHYVRFADGTQICWTRKTGSDINLNISQQEYPYPAAFVSNPSKPFGITTSFTVSANVRNALKNSFISGTNTHWYVRIPSEDRTEDSVDTSTGYQLFAIGRWM